MGNLFGGDKAPTVDMQPHADAMRYQADIQAKLQRETMADYRDMYDRSMELFDEVYGTQTRIAEEQWAQGKESYARWKEKFQPQEDKFLDRVNELQDPKYKALQQARAQAEIQQSFDAQRENAMQRMASMGVDPSQVRSGALDTNARNQMAAQQAAAHNVVGQQTDAMADNARMQAINVGKGYRAEGAQGLASAAGTYGGQMSQFGQAAQAPLGYGQMAQGYGGQALQGYQGAGQAILGGAQHNLQAHNANMANSPMNQLGSLAGTGLGVAASMGYSEGGIVPGDGQAIPAPEDKIPAMLAKDEYVVPADVLKWKGQEFFEKLQMKVRKDQEQGIPEGGQSAPQQGIPAGA